MPIAMLVLTHRSYPARRLDGMFSADAGYKFGFKGQTGAILMLDAPARKEVIASKRRIVNHMRAHLDRWMAYANDILGLELSRENLWFITGTTKTTRWVSAAFHGESQEKSASIQGDFANLATLKFSVKFEQESSVIQAAKYGPRRPGMGSPESSSQAVSAPGSSAAAITSPVSLLKNQCIFIHYYKAKKRFWRARSLFAAAGPHELPDDPGDEGGDTQATGNQSGDEVEIEEVPPPSTVRRRYLTVLHVLTYHLQPFDPVECLLDYILEVRALLRDLLRHLLIGLYRTPRPKSPLAAIAT